MSRIIGGLAGLALGAAAIAIATPAIAATKTTVILVHGAFVDGSGWAAVHGILSRNGYRVIVVQNPTTSLAEDAAATRRAITEAEGDVVLVGHSYGGVIISEVGGDQKVSALVYVAAFAPDKGESASSLAQNAPPGAVAPPILPPRDGFLQLDKTKFHAAFAADLPESQARFMADSQTPWGLPAAGGQIGSPAWKVKPSWYVVATKDRMISPQAQRDMAARARAKVIEVDGSHAVYVSNPRAIAALIEQAAIASAKAP